MNYFLGLLLVGSITATQIPEGAFVKPIKSAKISYTYKEVVVEAIFDCPYAKGGAKVELVENLARIERRYNLPHNLRGLLLAAACHESGYNPEAKGDHRFSKSKHPKAIGLFQMWPWWEKHYKINRADPYAAAEAYMQHIKKSFDKIKKTCKYKSEKRTWLAAWATAIRAPKAGGRCNEKPKFYRILKRWYKTIDQERETTREHEKLVPGC